MTSLELKKAIARAKAQERRACIKECRFVGVQWGHPTWKVAVEACITAIQCRRAP
jgi:hypothetical protein